MELPEEGDGAPRPWATWALLAATLAFQLATLGTPEPWSRFGLVPAAPGLLALVTHLFLHAGWLHLAGTLAFVALAGPWLEARLGRALFAATFFAAGLAGATLFVATHPGAETPWLGGSAAVAGLLGALLACLGRGRMELLGVAAGRAPRLRVPAWALAAFWVGRELAAFASEGTSGLAAHGGAFVFGAALAFALRRTGVIVDGFDEAPDGASAEHARVRPAPRPRLPVPSDPARLEALLGEAEHPELALAYLAHAESLGRRDAARAVVAARLWDAVEWRRREPAVALWCALAGTGAAGGTSVDALLQLAGWVRGAGHVAESTQALHAALAAGDAAAAAKIARATRRSDPLICYRAAERALADAALAASDRKVLEGLRLEAEREVGARGVIVVPAHAVAAPDPPHRSGSALAGRDEPSVPARAARPSPVPPRALQFGEAIELEVDPEPTPAPVALPDPGQAGDDAFLDAFHAALVDPEEAAPKDDGPPLRRLRVREALPRALESDALLLEVPGRKPVRLPLTKLHAVALAGVRGLSERTDKPVLIVDLLLSAEAEPELQLLRLRSDRFDPRRLCVVPEASPLKALRSFVAALATAAHAPLLPSAEVAGDSKLHIFRDLATYQREVLHADSPGDGPFPSRDSLG
jgi:membrane associated rhomboid family serine protease